MTKANLTTPPNSVRRHRRLSPTPTSVRGRSYKRFPRNFTGLLLIGGEGRRLSGASSLHCEQRSQVGTTECDSDKRTVTGHIHNTSAKYVEMKLTHEMDLLDCHAKGDAAGPDTSILGDRVSLPELAVPAFVPGPCFFMLSYHDVMRVHFVKGGISAMTLIHKAKPGTRCKLLIPYSLGVEERLGYVNLDLATASDTSIGIISFTHSNHLATSGVMHAAQHVRSTTLPTGPH